MKGPSPGKPKVESRAKSQVPGKKHAQAGSGSGGLRPPGAGSEVVGIVLKSGNAVLHRVDSLVLRILASPERDDSPRCPMDSRHYRRRCRSKRKAFGNKVEAGNNRVVQLAEPVISLQ